MPDFCVEQLKCKCCGAPLTRDGKCEYCGAIYRLENYQIIPVVAPKAVSLWAETRIPRDLLRQGHEDDWSQIALENLKASIADGLSGYLKLENSVDPYLNAVVIRGTVRVIPPDFRF